MWIAEKIAAAATPKTVERGCTSIGGKEVAVTLRGERRGIEVMTPGGYVWRPRHGEEVLVIKDSVSAEECIAAAKMYDGPKNMQGGEVFICSAGGTSIHLKNNGKIKICGNIVLDGTITYGDDESDEESGEGEGGEDGT